MLLYLKYHSFSSTSSKLISSLFILQLPIITYSQYVYTDLISGYLMLWGTLPLLSYLKKPSNWKLFVSSSIFGLASFLHIKLVQYTFLILVFFSIYILSKKLQIKIKSIKTIFLTKSSYVFLLKVFGLWSFFQLLFTFTMYRWYGEFSPAAAHNLLSQNSSEYSSFYTYNPVRIVQNFFGLFFGGESGLLANAPLFVLLFAGLIIWKNKNFQSFFIVAIPSIIFFFRQSMFLKWRTWGPPARYTIVFLPLILPAISYSILAIWPKKIGKIIVTTITLITIAFYYLLFQVQKSGYPLWINTNQYWESVFNKLNLPPNINKITFIDLVNPNYNDIIKTAVATIFIALISFYIIQQSKKY
ncbi:MAG: hypothetical protein HC932_05210 [Thermales bacterium]|nr:hypothetical protein [Thermales bacterium]